MSRVTYVLAKVSQADLAVARKTVSEYRDANGGSNRANWERITSVLAGVLAVIRTGMPVDVSDAYENEVGKSPAYNVLHRQLSAGVIRPHWHHVQAVGLINVVRQGNKITGIPCSTTTFTDGAQVLLCPVE